MLLFVNGISRTSLLQSVHHPMIALLRGLSICPLEEKCLSFISYFCRHSSWGHTTSANLFWKHILKLLIYGDRVHGRLPFLVQLKLLLRLVHFLYLVWFVATLAIDWDFGRIGNSGWAIPFSWIVWFNDNIAINTLDRLVQKVGLHGPTAADLFSFVIHRRSACKRCWARVIKGKAHTVVIPFALKMLLKANLAIGFDRVFENRLHIWLLRFQNCNLLRLTDYTL